MPIQLRRSLIALISCTTVAAALAPAGASAGVRHHRETTANSKSTTVSESGSTGESGTPREPGSQGGSSSSESGLGESGKGKHVSDKHGSGESGSGESDGDPSPEQANPPTPRFHGKCELTLQASSELVTAGETVTLAGRLVCPDSTSTAGETITVSQVQRGDGSPSSSELTATAEGDGSFQLTTAALTARSVFVAHAALARHGARAVVQVAPEITIDGPAAAGAQLATGGYRPAAGGRSRFTRNRFTFTGTVSQATPGMQVALQREYAAAGEQWTTIALGRVGAEGRYSITHGFRSAGQVSVRVVAGPQGEVRSASEPLTYDIVQAQNPKLTIESSDDLLDSGEAATLTGVAAGADDQTVTLLAQTPENGYAPVTKVTTSSTGAYTFTVTPLQNTSYRVLSSTGEVSTALFEGVRYTLDPPPPPSTVQNGATVTFSGTVTPIPAGQAVYLECENTYNIDFHTVSSATVSPTGAYSITYAFNGVGSRIMRIKVPHSPHTESTTSPPFTITVTPSATGSAEDSEAPAEAGSGEG